MALILSLLEVKAKHQLRKASSHSQNYLSCILRLRKPIQATPPSTLAPRGEGGRDRGWAWLGDPELYLRLYT